MRVAILWTHLSGFLNASLRALAAKPAVEMYVAHRAAGEAAPYSSSLYDWIPQRYEYIDAPDVPRLLVDLARFRPDVILASWHVKAFQHCCLRLKSTAARVACADNPWRGNLRQRLAGVTSPFHLERFYDAAFVPGERQEEWAHHMGLHKIWRGLNAADIDSFSAAASATPDTPPTFLFTGRLVPDKGIDVLARAYAAYADGVDSHAGSPWPCMVAGTGPLGGLLSHSGFNKLGFVQPPDMPRLFARASCFVLPSVDEHWGVVLQEAAAAGLPIICTRECGSAVHLVQDNYNGFVVETGSVQQLASAMERMTNLPLERRQQMSAAGRPLAQQFTPERWATTILEKGTELRERLKGRFRNT